MLAASADVNSGSKLLPSSFCRYALAGVSPGFHRLIRRLSLLDVGGHAFPTVFSICALPLPRHLQNTFVNRYFSGDTAAWR